MATLLFLVLIFSSQQPLARGEGPMTVCLPVTVCLRVATPPRAPRPYPRPQGVIAHVLCGNDLESLLYAAHKVCHEGLPLGPIRTAKHALSKGLALSVCGFRESFTFRPWVQVNDD